MGVIGFSKFLMNVFVGCAPIVPVLRHDVELSLRYISYSVPSLEFVSSLVYQLHQACRLQSRSHLIDVCIVLLYFFILLVVSISTC